MTEEWKRRNDTVVQDMYEGCRIVVKCAVGVVLEFKIMEGLHHGSALLFLMVMNRLTDEILETSLDYYTSQIIVLI